VKDEIAELVKHGRIRNQLLTARTVECELSEAARRVVRLSKAGTPERMLTLAAVADESGLSAGAIVKAIIQAQRRDLEQL
jgi:hypothetical protein